MEAADLIFRNIRQLITCAGPAPRRGADQGAVPIIAGGALASLAGRIVYAGATSDLDTEVAPTPRAQIIDAAAHSIVPGFVDAHTHAIFAGDRREELRRRLAGATYAEIAAGGGGIVSTVRATRAASEDDLVAVTRPRRDEMLACGTTTCEIKSGYGLSLESELKLLRAVRRLSGEHPLDIVPTFLGAHQVPLEDRERRDEDVRLGGE